MSKGKLLQKETPTCRVNEKQFLVLFNKEADRTSSHSPLELYKGV